MGEQVVCGIDLGSFTSTSYVAWLRGRRFLLDLYRASAEMPLPSPPAGWPMARWVMIDGPQGLPSQGKVRAADREAPAAPSPTAP